MTDILKDLQKWYDAQCNDDWEHQYGISITTLDNPGWSVKINLTGTLLEDAPFSPVEIDESHESWLFCRVDEAEFRGHGDPSRLAEMLGIFIAWAKQDRPDWLAAPSEPKIEARSDRAFWDVLGEEIGPEKCRRIDCPHKCIRHSVLCRRHHFESIKGKPYPVAEAGNEGSR